MQIVINIIWVIGYLVIANFVGGAIKWTYKLGKYPYKDLLLDDIYTNTLLATLFLGVLFLIGDIILGITS